MSRQSEQVFQPAAVTLIQFSISENVRLALTRAVESQSLRTLSKSPIEEKRGKVQIRTRQPFQAT